MTTGTAIALALPQPAVTALAAVLVLATAVWIGGLVAIFVVARVARATLGPAERVAQARRMTRLRQEAMLSPVVPRWRRWCGGARNATVLRAAIAAFSLTLLALGTLIAT